MPVGAELAAAPTPLITVENGRDVSGSVSVIRQNVVNDFLPSGSAIEFSISEGSLSPSGIAVNPVEPSGPNYSDVVRGENPDPVKYVPDVENELPSRPLTVSFNPRT